MNVPMVKRKEETNIELRHDILRLLKCCCTLILEGAFCRKVSTPNFEASLIPLAVIFAFIVNAVNTLLVLAFGIACRGLDASVLGFIKGFFLRLILVNSVYIVFSVSLAITLQLRPERSFLICNAALAAFPIPLAVYCLQICEPRPVFMIFILTTTRKILGSVWTDEDTWRKSILKLYVAIVQLVVFKIYRSSIFCDF